ncbi:MAG: hypothetical protein E4G99_12190 [Anaerolineales bacterium]|nr:MAG: hypothetical protein E4G99_12190 [Anaerolineales bacterium]
MKSRPAILILLVSLCFCLGLGTVLLGEQTDASTIERLISLFPPGGLGDIFSPARGEQTTVLLLGIDRFDRPDPALRAIWLLAFEPPDPKVMLSGVPSNLDLVPGADVTLDSFFGWTPDGVVAPPFLEALERALRVEVDVVVIMDEYAFGALVDYLGGMPLEAQLGLPFEGDVLSGPQVLALHTVFEGDPVSLVGLQASVLSGLLPQAAKLGPNPDLGPILALAPDHADVSINPTQFAVLLSHLLPIKAEYVTVQTILAPIP